MMRTAVTGIAGLACLLLGVVAWNHADFLGVQLPGRMDATRHVKLSSGYSMPLLGWGSSGAKDSEALHAVKAAIKAGFRHIDDAEMYGNEEAIGQGIHESIKAGEVRRRDLFIVSKLGNNHHAAEAVLPAVQASLSKLQLDYLDLYHIHWPNSQETGPSVLPPFNETWAAMESLVDQGLVRSIGVSNFSPEKIKSILKSARIKPAVNQVEVHLNFRNERTIDWCNQEGIHVTAYAPLSSPQTMSSQKKSVPNLLKDPEVTQVAESNDKTVAQTLLRWGLEHGTSVIPKSSNPSHIQDHLPFSVIASIQENQGAWGWKLPRKDYDALSSRIFQQKYFDGGFVMSPEGPYRTYENLWDEPEP